MAKKGGGGNRKQGIVSWLTSFFALFIGLGPIWHELAYLFSGGNMATSLDTLDRTYNPLRKDTARLSAGYGSLLGGIVFKTVSSELTKRAQLRSIIPALHA